MNRLDSEKQQNILKINNKYMKNNEINSLGEYGVESDQKVTEILYQQYGEEISRNFQSNRDLQGNYDVFNNLNFEFLRLIFLQNPEIPMVLYSQGCIEYDEMQNFDAEKAAKKYGKYLTKKIWEEMNGINKGENKTTSISEIYLISEGKQKVIEVLDKKKTFTQLKNEILNGDIEFIDNRSLLLSSASKVSDWHFIYEEAFDAETIRIVKDKIEEYKDENALLFLLDKSSFTDYAYSEILESTSSSFSFLQTLLTKELPDVLLQKVFLQALSGYETEKDLAYVLKKITKYYGGNAHTIKLKGIFSYILDMPNIPEELVEQIIYQYNNYEAYFKLKEMKKNDNSYLNNLAEIEKHGPLNINDALNMFAKQKSNYSNPVVIKMIKKILRSTTATQEDMGEFITNCKQSGMICDTLFLTHKEKLFQSIANFDIASSLIWRISNTGLCLSDIMKREIYTYILFTYPDRKLLTPGLYYLKEEDKPKIIGMIIPTLQNIIDINDIYYGLSQKVGGGYYNWMAKIPEQEVQLLLEQLKEKSIEVCNEELAKINELDDYITLLNNLKDGIGSIQPESKTCVIQKMNEI